MRARTFPPSRAQPDGTAEAGCPCDAKGWAIATTSPGGAVHRNHPALLGFDPSIFGGHSLRADFVTSAVKRSANLIKNTDVTGHRSLEMLKNLFERRRGIRGSRRRGTAVGGDMTHE